VAGKRKRGPVEKISELVLFEGLELRNQFLNLFVAGISVRNIADFLQVLWHPLMDHSPILSFAAVVRSKKASVGKPGVIVALEVVVGPDGNVFRLASTMMRGVRESDLSLAPRQMMKSAPAPARPEPLAGDFKLHVQLVGAEAVLIYQSAKIFLPDRFLGRFSSYFVRM
jgi:hypothetical protein